MNATGRMNLFTKERLLSHSSGRPTVALSFCHMMCYRAKEDLLMGQKHQAGSEFINEKWRCHNRRGRGQGEASVRLNCWDGEGASAPLIK